MSVHTDKIASVLRRAVQQIITRGLNDPRLRGMISVTEIRVSADLASATVLVSVMPSEHAELTLHGLRHAARHIRSEVGKIVSIRRMPQLSFKLDESLRRQMQVLTAINEARRSDEEMRRRRSEMQGEESES